jgi:beta-lactamase superfamily II metal-dependent hydrolase
MAEEIQLRLVTVEFLRPGPAHNQLLSPLTQYLAICGDQPVGVVTVPYEQAAFERRLKELRYETGDPGDRLAMLHEVGVEMSKILGAVPGLPGALISDPNQPGVLVHLRLIHSASELAFLPFELTKMPGDPNASAESWLGIQIRPPVCITRNIRTVSPEGVLWPDTPRILFIAGDQAHTPYLEHRGALLEAIAPFRYWGKKPDDDFAVSADGSREQFGDLLTILINPTLSDVLRESRTARYTHVHILTHGNLDPGAHDRYGLVLHGPADEPEVVSGERFASAITFVGDGRIHRPTVVTVASCDSGNVGSVVLPGASFAHSLHYAGVPLVVASQFPLSMEGSVPLTATLYKGLLWGDHPLQLVSQARAELHARYTAAWHDWAGLVVYEALPRVLAEQLDALRYKQARRAINAALQRVDLAVEKAAEPHGEPGTGTSLNDLVAAVEAAVRRLPLNGHYGMECLGLRASSRKRLAQASHAVETRGVAATIEAWSDPYSLLEQARRDYEQAARSFLVNEAHALQRIATLHWVLVQVASLSVILGREISEGVWHTAKETADLYVLHHNAEERAWAHGSLAELWLLRLGRPGLTADQQQDLSEHALHHAEQLVSVYPARDVFPVISTCRQFVRYVEWWGTQDFAREVPARPSWDGDFGLVATAKRLVEVLQKKERVRPPPAASSPKRGTGPEAPGTAAPSAGDSGGAASTLSGTSTKGTTRRTQARARPPRRAAPFFDITMLPAGHGDCLWIEYGDHQSSRRWLIDCGTQGTARELLRRVEALPEPDRFLELFVMSHIDADHIGGALPFFKSLQLGLRFGDVWFNGWRHVSGRLGSRQGEMFSTAIQDFELPWNVWRDGGPIVVDGDELPVHVLPGDMTLTLLSPTPKQLQKLAPVWTRELKRHGLEPGARVDYRKFLSGTPPSTSTDVDELADAPFSSDSGAPNGSSIALLAEFGGATALLAADAHAPVLVGSIRTLLRHRQLDRLRLDAFKLAHHTSQNNLSKDLLELLDCPRYLVSTNGDHFYHPDRQAIARVIKYGGRPSLYFNYKSRYNDVWGQPDLQEKYQYSAYYPDGAPAGSTVSLLADSD